MPSDVKPAPALQFQPLTPDRWPDLEALFGEKGAYGGCWCMWWRLTRARFQEQHGAGNKRAMKGIVESGEAPGVLAYAASEPVGWCAVAPREAYPSLSRSRTLKPVDDEPVWSITCFFVAEAFRGRGVMASLLKAASEYAGKRGARIIEGYPVDSSKRVHPAWQAYLGTISTFRQAGFVEVVRRSARQPIMRYTVQDQ